jgi:group I intron endonuclease
MIFNYNTYSKSSGVYKITNTITNRIYIGSAKRFKSRWSQHSKSLVEGKHSNKFLLNDFNKCKQEQPDDSFIVFDILEVTDEKTKEERLEIEQKYIDLYFDKQEVCYNFCKKAGSREGCATINKEEFSKKMSEQVNKLWSNPEHRELMSKKLSEYYSTDEQKQIMSDRFKQLWSTQEYKEKMSSIQKQRFNKLTKQEKQNHTKPALETCKKIKKTLSQKSAETKYKNKQNQIPEIKQTTDFIGTTRGRVRTYSNANLIAPDGILFVNITNLLELSKKYNTDPEKLRLIITGKRLSSNGWFKHIEKLSELNLEQRRLKEDKTTVIYQAKVYGSLISPDDKIYENVTHIPTFAKEHGLIKQNLYSLLLGKVKSCQGWKLA